MPSFEPIIGLEIHVQLKTRSKMFCGCSNYTTVRTAPNTNVCPICLGHPGVLPVPNEQAIRFAVLFGLAVKGTTPPFSKFDRKHYFYPDLPKGYQISQYDLPVVQGGYFDIHMPNPKARRSDVRVRLTRAHLEEDAAKNTHAGDKSYIDFNRSGAPLLEIVTEPDLRTPEEAKLFLQELRLLVRALGLGDGDMEKGHLRCDANISLRQLDAEGNGVGLAFNPKTEIKNINSFRHVERALTYEIGRQSACWEAGHPPSQNTTRGWNDEKQKTEEQRTKEEAADYRYFPEPDIPPLQLTELVEEMRAHLPELPQQKRLRFMDEYGFSRPEADALTSATEIADFTERVLSELDEWLSNELNAKRFVKLAASWLIHKLPGLLNDRGGDLKTMKVSPENFAELLSLIAKGTLTQTAAGIVLQEMLESGADPTHVMEEKQLGAMEDMEALSQLIAGVLAHHADEVSRYRAGEAKLLQFFIGMVMKETDGKAEPSAMKRLLLAKLSI